MRILLVSPSTGLKYNLRQGRKFIGLGPESLKKIQSKISFLLRLYNCIYFHLNEDPYAFIQMVTLKGITFSKQKLGVFL